MSYYERYGKARGAEARERRAEKSLSVEEYKREVALPRKIAQGLQGSVQARRRALNIAYREGIDVEKVAKDFNIPFDPRNVEKPIVEKPVVEEPVYKIPETEIIVKEPIFEEPVYLPPVVELPVEEPSYEEPLKQVYEEPFVEEPLVSKPFNIATSLILLGLALIFTVLVMKK